MDGLHDGAVDGSIVEQTLGTRLGISDRSILGATVDSKDGNAVERLDGIKDGLQDGTEDG